MRFEVEARHLGVGQSILEGAVGAGSEFVEMGDEHGAGRSDARIEESKTVADKSGMDLGEACQADGEVAGPVGLYVGTSIGTNERALRTGVGPQIASNQRQIDRCRPLGRP
jgi:hypothetical protein